MLAFMKIIGCVHSHIARVENLEVGAVDSVQSDVLHGLAYWVCVLRCGRIGLCID